MSYDNFKNTFLQTYKISGTGYDPLFEETIRAAYMISLEKKVEELKAGHKKLMEIAMSLAEEVQEGFEFEGLDIPATDSVIELSKYRTELKELESE